MTQTINTLFWIYHETLLTQFVLVILLGGYLLYRGITSLVKARRVMNVPTSKVGFAHPGFVELQGYAWSSETRTNLDGRPAVFHQLELQKLESTEVGGSKRSQWRTISRIQFNPNFYLVDDSGCVEVDVSQLEVEVGTRIMPWRKLTSAQRQEITDRFNADTKPKAEIPDEVRQALQKVSKYADKLRFFFGPPPVEVGLFHGHSHRCVEKCILVGSPLLLQGDLRSAHAAPKTANELPTALFHSGVKSATSRLASSKMSTDRYASTKNAAMNSKSEVETLEALALEKDKYDGDKVPYFGVVGRHSQKKSFATDCHQEQYVKRLGGRSNWILIILGIVAFAYSAIIWPKF